MFRNPTADVIVVLVIVLLIFGPKRLPGLGKQLGTGLRELASGIRCVENFAARGRVRMEDADPRLAADIRDVVEPRTHADRVLDSLRHLRGNERWYRRQWRRALARLKQLAESGEQPERVVVAGADRIPS